MRPALQPNATASGIGGESAQGAAGSAEPLAVARPAARRDCLQEPVLVLNRYFAAISTTTVRRALGLLFAGSARALDEHGDSHDFSTWRDLPVRAEEEWLPIVDGGLRVPRVLHLQRYDRVPVATLRLTRANLMLRDGHECQYCGARPGTHGLDLDHILPRSRGGADTWQNLVTSCRRCNLRKGRKTPEEAGMRLSRKPTQPHWSIEARILLACRRRFVEWEPFLGTEGLATATATASASRWR